MQAVTVTALGSRVDALRAQVNEIARPFKAALVSEAKHNGKVIPLSVGEIDGLPLSTLQSLLTTLSQRPKAARLLGATQQPQQQQTSKP